jgi:RHH-type proline utilization regulon transcriptional repressor/proline dehydrogenase/delta 1-pyrroline-5-carboxylate dehydrogenase
MRSAITNAYRMDETLAVDRLLSSVSLTHDQEKNIHDRAYQLVEKIRLKRFKQGGIDAFLSTYSLSTEEGIALMCIAEAMLRIPDKTTIDDLIRDKFSDTEWKNNAGKSESTFVNVATWTLMLTGKIVSHTDETANVVQRTTKNLIQRASEPVIRAAVAHAMRILGAQFVMGRTIVEALSRAKDDEKHGYTHSFDMLGESAKTDADAAFYFKAYHDAIETVGKQRTECDYRTSSGISIKLSALYPRYEFAQQEIAVPFLIEKITALVLLAKQYDVGVTIDAEESYRLDISLDIIEAVFLHPELSGWEGFGLALQAYQKRAFYVIDFLQSLCEKAHKKMMVRLVKGAYWDAEIKRTQEAGLNNYAVFTRKVNTDVSYIACAKKLLDGAAYFYPQFATHNPQTLSTILEFAQGRTNFEFQCLHGMGQNLYDHIVGKKADSIRCRIYAPVGSHKDLLPYLVRRLLENGANTSFVNRIMDKSLSIDEIIVDPLRIAAKATNKQHPHIPLPEDLFGKQRKNSRGLDMTNLNENHELHKALKAATEKKWEAVPLIANHTVSPLNFDKVLNPAFHDRVVGKAADASEKDVLVALENAVNAAERWDNVSVSDRAAMLDKVAYLFEQHQAELMYLAIHEAGKTIPDAIGEVREAVDFCRYYAAQARKQLAEPTVLQGVTGEFNQLELHGRGAMVCISPWNFPLAIFTGQIVAALVSGNTVMAKPSEQTRLIAGLAVQLFHKAGIPKDVIQLVPGRGSVIGALLISDPRVQGVIFTGSTEVAKFIQKSLANRDGAIVPLVAETGGQNAMIVDSSALPEQVVDDVISSAFGSAGQRCSALRILFLQNDIADNVLKMLKGAMAKLNVGDPSLLSTDIGPVIDADAQSVLQAHIENMRQEAQLIAEVKLSSVTNNGTFVAPVVFEIKNLSQLKREVFGPVLHVIRFDIAELDKVIAEINHTGYGLTLGIHSRVQERVRYIHQRIHVGNTYVNRNIIGAVVGVQPFGGEGLSGTGPKAGGPHYLTRLCVERTLTINTTATGGNASLLTLKDN